MRGDEGSWRGEDAGERDCKGWIREDCQAWKETALVAAGELEVPCLRTGCRATQVPTEDEVQVVATAVGAEESRPTLGKRGQGGGRRQGRGNTTGRRKKAKPQQQRGGGRGDGGQKLQATEVRRVKGQGGRGARNQGKVQGDRQKKGLGGSRSSEAVEVRDDMLPCPRGEGPGWRADEEAYLWDARTGQILNQDGTPTRNEAAVAAEEERIKDTEATGASADICAGTQSMGPVYLHRKKHAYLPLDDEEDVFSAAQGAVSKPPDWSHGPAGSSRCRGWLSPVACIRRDRQLLAVACRLCPGWTM